MSEPRNLGDADENETKSPTVRDAYRADKHFYRVIAYSLGIAIGLSIVCSTVTFVCTQEVPDGVTAIGSAAVGALAGVFTASRA